MCKSNILCNNHRLGVDVLSLCVLILSVANVLIVLTVPWFMNVCRLCCMEWHQTGLVLALSMCLYTVIFVLYFPVILNFMLFSLKTGEVTFQTLCSHFSLPPAHSWRIRPDIWQVFGFLLKCQQLWSRVTSWTERRWITCLVAGLEFFGKSWCHLSMNKGDDCLAEQRCYASPGLLVMPADLAVTNCQESKGCIMS